MPENSNRYWKTGDWYLAAYLFARGAIVVGIEAKEGRPMFSFLDSLERQSLQQEYRAGKPMVDARIYVYALRDLREKGNHAVRQAHEAN